eukprot:800345-Rhodomonas_salina.1
MPTPSRVTWWFLPEPVHDCTNSSPSCMAVPHRTERKVTPPLLQTRRGLDDEVSGNHRQSLQRQ